MLYYIILEKRGEQQRNNQVELLSTKISKRPFCYGRLSHVGTEGYYDQPCWKLGMVNSYSTTRLLLYLTLLDIVGFIATVSSEIQVDYTVGVMGS